MQHPYEDVKRYAILLRRSGYVCWPRPGGLENQVSSLVDDIATYLWLEEWAVEQHRKDNAGDEETEKRPAKRYLVETQIERGVTPMQLGRVDES